MSDAEMFNLYTKLEGMYAKLSKMTGAEADAYDAEIAKLETVLEKASDEAADNRSCAANGHMPRICRACYAGRN